MSKGVGRRLGWRQPGPVLRTSECPHGPYCPMKKAFDAVTIAKDAIAIIVNPKNPIYNLSLNQIREVFSRKG